jgi:hypothetical protein
LGVFGQVMLVQGPKTLLRMQPAVQTLLFKNCGLTSSQLVNIVRNMQKRGLAPRAEAQPAPHAAEHPQQQQTLQGNKRVQALLGSQPPQSAQPAPANDYNREQ